MKNDSHISRRQFLHRGALLRRRGGGAAVDSLRRSGRPDRPGANDRIGIGGIGVGPPGQRRSGQAADDRSSSGFVAVADVNINGPGDLPASSRPSLPGLPQAAGSQGR